MLKLNSNYSDYTDETDVNYPEGKAVNASSSESFDGTPLLAEFMNDVNASHIAMYEKAYGTREGISGDPDTQKSSQFAAAVAKYTDDKVKAHTDQRGLANGVHGATAEATAGQIVSRDEYGRAKVAAPIDNNDIVNKGWVLDAVWPVGSIYFNSRNVNPNTYFGGIWVQIVDKFILAAGDLYAANATGGASTATLSVDNLPSHNHTFTGTEVTTSGMSANSNGIILLRRRSYATLLSATGNFTGSSDNAAGYNTVDQVRDTTAASDSGRIKIYNNIAHTHKVTAAGTIGNAGNGTAVDIMPPYIAKYCWERTA